MHITRIQVEEGFLDGLDVSLSAGLNVLIGARGTGKTSLIELVRFCLNVQSYTGETEKRSKEHALSVLGSGQVTVTLKNGDQDVLVSRTVNDEEPRSSGPYRRPIIFSQTEIETVGLKPGGRLSLLDGFIQERVDSQQTEKEEIAAVRSLTSEIDHLKRELEEYGKQVSQMGEIENKLKELAPKEALFSKLSKDAANKKSELDKLGGKMASKGVASETVERFRISTDYWQDSLSTLLSSIPVQEAWPESGGDDLLSPLFVKIKAAAEHLEKAQSLTSSALDEADKLLKNLNQDRITDDNQVRQLRREIDSLQSGAGEIARESQQLKEKKAQLQSLQSLLTERRKKLQSLITKRDAHLDALEEVREKRFSARKKVADKLNGILGPRISIEVQRAGQFSAFAAAISESLRGSGLRYKELAPLLAERVSPRELIEAIDQADYDLISDLTDISRERAAKIISHLQEADIAELATINVEDYAAFQLLDVSDYKDISQLSTGQRCTVILPLVLQHTERVLIVDQPEDHIDNAFITETLIQSIASRPKDGQIIFSTHNANIPVLGNAERVIQMGSDGKRGFVLESAPLNNSRVVHAISTVMEGGVVAFKRRAQFYETNS